MFNTKKKCILEGGGAFRSYRKMESVNGVMLELGLVLISKARAYDFRLCLCCGFGRREKGK